MNIKTGDTVKLLTGGAKYRGKTGKVLAVSPKEDKVIVEGINVVKKHVKPRKAGDPSGIIDTEAAIYASKVQLVCPKCGNIASGEDFKNAGADVNDMYNCCIGRFTKDKGCDWAAFGLFDICSVHVDGIPVFDFANKEGGTLNG